MTCSAPPSQPSRLHPSPEHQRRTLRSSFGEGTQELCPRCSTNLPPSPMSFRIGVFLPLASCFHAASSWVSCSSPGLSRHGTTNGDTRIVSTASWAATTSSLRLSQRVEVSEVHVPDEHVCDDASPSLPADHCCNALQRTPPSSPTPQPQYTLHDGGQTCHNGRCEESREGKVESSTQQETEWLRINPCGPQTWAELSMGLKPEDRVGTKQSLRGISQTRPYLLAHETVAPTSEWPSAATQTLAGLGSGSASRTGVGTPLIPSKKGMLKPARTCVIITVL